MAPTLPSHAVLLVGGRGTRMWPLTADTPKPLLPLAGIPFVEYQLRQLAAVGVTDVVLAIGAAQRGAWERYLEEGFEGLALRLAVEDGPLDTAGPVVEILDSLPDRFLVLNGDVAVQTDLSRLGEANGRGVVGLVEVEDTSAYGVVVLDDTGRVERFVEKPPPEEAPARTVNAGLYLLEKEALAGNAPGPLSFERAVFPGLAERGALYGVVLKGNWLDIGTPTLYLAAHDDVFSGRVALNRPDEAHAAAGAEVRGDLGGAWAWVGEGAVIGDGARVDEALVFPGAIVEADCVVTRAAIGAGARIGAGSVVRGESVIGPGAVVGTGCEIDRGVRIAPYAQLSSGAVTFSPPA